MATVDTDWEETFRRWSKPSSETEQTKSDNAVSMIRAAIRECPVLSQRTIEVFAQGSYRNNTNVRADHDVDVCVRCLDTCCNDFSEVPGLTLQGAGLEPATYAYPQFKNEVGAAPVEKFGATRRNFLVPVRDEGGAVVVVFARPCDVGDAVADAMQKNGLLLRR